jgi:hypothetical protein
MIRLILMLVFFIYIYCCKHKDPKNIYLKTKGYIEVPDVETNKSKLVKLFNQDQIYEQIRTMYVSEIFVHLKKVVRLLKDIREVRNLSFIFILLHE